MRSLPSTGCPHPSSCELFYVNRDTLFSYHPVSETFLQRMMNLYVASHYKNSPNDLQLMRYLIPFYIFSDAPAHHLFCLLPPISENATSTLPDPLVVVQIALEGSISRKTALAALEKGKGSAGDLIPWVMTSQFQDEDFAGLNGARIVRIATHPDYIGMGYGARAVELIEEYYSGKFSVSMDEDLPATSSKKTKASSEAKLDKDDSSPSVLDKEKIAVRDASSMPPLLMKLSERPLEKHEHLNWLGVSYGLTGQLHKFWKRGGFIPLYIGQNQNDITGEHTCVMLKALTQDSPAGITVARPDWLNSFAWDFRKRLAHLLGHGSFAKFSPITVLSILEAVGACRTGNNELSSSRGLDARMFLSF